MQVGLPKAAGNLRERLSSFVGRDAELEQLREALRCSRLVTLTGPGGGGQDPPGGGGGRRTARRAPKRRLARRAGQRRQGRRAAPATASALEASAFAGPQPAGSTTQLIVRHLAGRSLVVVLDNCEHVIGEAAALADTLLGAVPGLRLIATSREPLGIPGEVLVPWARWPGGAPRGHITRSPMSQMWPRSRRPCADYSLSGPARQRQPPPRVVSPRSFGRRRRDPPQTTRRSPGHHLRPADLSPTSAHPGNLALMQPMRENPSHHDHPAAAGLAVDVHGRVVTAKRQAAARYRQAQRAADSRLATTALRLAVHDHPPSGSPSPTSTPSPERDAITGTASQSRTPTVIVLEGATA
jgi:hypothetical protein